MSTEILIQLGKAGDIINLLPLCYDEAQRGNRMAIMACEPFASVLDGVSYCDKLVYAGEAHDLDGALTEARKLSDKVKCVQVVGPPDIVKRCTYAPAGMQHAVTDSFQKEAWLLAGKFDLWKKNIPLVFDRRNKEREAELIARVIPKTKKKIMLLALGGNSSPFQYRELLTELLTLKFNRQYELINISELKCERIYDLIGLYEIASVLIATDSAPLHLARSTSLSTVALVNDLPSLWHGSAWRPNHVSHVRYGDFTRRFEAILQGVSGQGKAGCFTTRNGEPTLIHCWSGYELTEESKPRHEKAKESWRHRLYDTGSVSCQIDIGAIGRDSKSHLKEGHRFPFVKDVLRLSCLRAKSPDDSILLTRHDSQLEGMPKLESPYYSRRITRSEKGDKTESHIDLFCFTKQWWLDHQHEYPDMVMGRDPYWGRILSELMKLNGGQEVRGVCWREPGAIIQHEKTPAYYGYNAHHAQEFLTSHQLIHKGRPVDSQVQSTVINSDIIPRFGYNPSLIRWRNRLLLCFRFHHAGTLSTRLGMAELNDNLSVMRWSQVRINDELTEHSYEDPRLFLFRDQLFIAFVESQYPKNFYCVQKYAELFEDSKGWRTAASYQPRYGKNDFTGMEKNWCPFEHEDALHFIYDSKTILKMDADYAEEIKTEEAQWDYGDIKGGVVINRGDHLLRLFHSRRDDEMPPHPWRYYVGWLKMENKSPFRILEVGKTPLLQASEEGGRQDAFHFKPKVVFPGGAVEVEGGVLVSCGVNDSQMMLCKVKV